VSAESAPLLSLILVTDGWPAIRDVVRCLGKQTIRERLELVVVLDAEHRFGRRDELAAFGSVHLVEVDAAAVAAVHPARVAGVRAAHAPIVYFAETHSFPEPELCAELLAAFERSPCTAVGAGMLNANPDSMLSWAGLLLDYGQWLAGGIEGPRDHVAGHNGAYRRQALLAYGDRLGELMRADTVLTAQLRADGHRFHFAPAARTRHLNVSRLRPFLLERFAAGREFAAARVAGAPLLRRLLFVAGSPLIPLIRLLRVRDQVARVDAAHRPPWRALPALCLALVTSAAGELWGYAFGASASGALRLAEIEVHRSRFVAGDWRAHLGLDEG